MMLRFLLIPLLFFCLPSLAQPSLSPLSKGDWHITVGGAYFEHPFFELGLGRGLWEEEERGLSIPIQYEGYQLASEFKITDNELLMGPKIGYHYSYLILNMGGNLIYYTDFKNGTPFVRPQLGFTAIGIFDLAYGYNLPIQMDTPFEETVNTHNISLLWRVGKSFSKPASQLRYGSEFWRPALLLFLVLSLLLPTKSFGQRPTRKKNFNISLGTKRMGIAFGNPLFYTGVRFGIIDKDCNINGLSFTVVSTARNYKNAVTNGLSFGLISATANKVNGISCSPILNSTNAVNGLGIGGFVNNVPAMRGISLSGLVTLSQDLKGFSYSGLYTVGDRIGGISLSGLVLIGNELVSGFSMAGYRMDGYEMKGMFIAPVIATFDKDLTIERVKGFSISAYTRMNFLKGVALSGRVKVYEKMRGASISFMNHANEVEGVQIGLINKTNQLNGLQIGLINLRKNDHTGWFPYKFRPFLNMKFSPRSGQVRSGDLRKRKIKLDKAKKGKKDKKGKSGKRDKK